MCRTLCTGNITFANTVRDIIHMICTCTACSTALPLVPHSLVKTVTAFVDVY